MTDPKYALIAACNRFNKLEKEHVTIEDRLRALSLQLEWAQASAAARHGEREQAGLTSMLTMNTVVPAELETANLALKDAIVAVEDVEAETRKAQEHRALLDVKLERAARAIIELRKECDKQALDEIIANAPPLNELDKRWIKLNRAN